jgi:hypothetical protein
MVVIGLQKGILNGLFSDEPFQKKPESFCLFIYQYKPKKSLLRLSTLARSKTPGSISTWVA